MKILWGVLGAAAVAAFALLSGSVVSASYAQKIEAGGPLEQKYLAAGVYEVAYFEQAAMENYEKYEIWYPSEMEHSDEKYPVVVINNGTGVKASKCKALWEHLASWGFIVIANEEEYSWNGFAADMSLQYLLKANEDSESIFFSRIDTENIGVSGHSQGGVGVVNAITNTRHAQMYKAAFAASITQPELSLALEWEYDASKITIPFFMVAGTGDIDAQTILPLEAMTQLYDVAAQAPIRAMARRAGADHGDMLTAASGYETAWFLWLLRGDEEAAGVFTGSTPELVQNALYQDQSIESGPAPG